MATPAIRARRWVNAVLDEGRDAILSFGTRGESMHVRQLYWGGPPGESKE